jgi:hypothetical protein
MPSQDAPKPARNPLYVSSLMHIVFLLTSLGRTLPFHKFQMIRSSLLNPSPFLLLSLPRRRRRRQVLWSNWLRTHPLLHSMSSNLFIWLITHQSASNVYMEAYLIDRPDTTHKEFTDVWQKLDAETKKVRLSICFPLLDPTQVHDRRKPCLLKLARRLP